MCDIADSQLAGGPRRDSPHRGFQGFFEIDDIYRYGLSGLERRLGSAFADISMKLKRCFVQFFFSSSGKSVFSRRTSTWNGTTSLLITPTAFRASARRPLDGAGKNEAGQFEFTFVGDSGATYLIETSTELTTWTPLHTVVMQKARRGSSIPMRPTSANASTARGRWNRIV